LPHRLGRYSVLEYLGRGGMADLYRARSVDGRVVVIKEVTPELAKKKRYVELLAAEAQLTAMMQHPNVIRVVGFGKRPEGGLPYIALEHIDGLDLRTLLRECTKRRIPLPIKHALGIVAAVLRGLDHAHRARDESGRLLEVVHRDVSPSNVLLGFDGAVRLCDFGIARSTMMPEVPESIEGKAGYMSPEHARGDEMTARSDVYAVGILLWELLHGRRMRKGKGMALLAQARGAEVPVMVVRGLHDEAALHAIVRRALDADPEERFSSAGEMLGDLERYIASAKLTTSEPELAAFLKESFPAELEAQQWRRVRLLAAPEVDEDVTPSAPNVERTSMVSGPRRIQRADARVEPRRPTDLLFLGALTCAATLAALSALSSLGMF
jgi:eukaryotic-like serine/threonine-protein kinase